MTFLTKPSLMVKKAPLINEKYEEVIEVDGAHSPEEDSCAYYGSSIRLMLFITCATFIVALFGAATGYVFYRDAARTTAVIARYQGFCTVPINTKDESDAASHQLVNLQWSSEPDVQIFSTASENNSEDVINALREQLDITDTVERISVVDNSRHVDFIHDFDANVTGIVDQDRCFAMEMDPQYVLVPEVFVLSIEGGLDFDVSRVRTALRAALPALQRLASAARDYGAASQALAEHCRDKPTYELTKDEGVAIRKRGVDAPPHDYMHFAGRHVQEIEIVNLADLLQREQAVAAGAGAGAGAGPGAA